MTRIDFDRVVWWDVEHERERLTLAVDRVTLLFSDPQPVQVSNQGLEALRAKLTREGVSEESMRLWTRDAVVAYLMVTGDFVLAAGTKPKKLRLFRRIATKLELSRSDLDQMGL